MQRFALTCRRPDGSSTQDHLFDEADDVDGRSLGAGHPGHRESEPDVTSPAAMGVAWFKALGCPCTQGSEWSPGVAAEMNAQVRVIARRLEEVAHPPAAGALATFIASLLSPSHDAEPASRPRA